MENPIEITDEAIKNLDALVKDADLQAKALLLLIDIMTKNQTKVINVLMKG